VIRIAYFGLPLAALLLKRDGVEPQMAVLAPPDAPGRRRLRRALGDRVLDARDFANAEELEAEVSRRLSSEPPDLVVSWYWTRRLPSHILERPRLGAIGVHPSLLPRHRGPNPFFAAIDAGDAASGVTVHRLTLAYDQGDVIAQEVLDVGDRNAWQLARALDRPGLRALRRVVRQIADGETPPARPQDERAATWAPEPTLALVSVDWHWPTSRVLRRIRALSPVPGLALEIRGTELFVTAARATPDFPRTLLPGEAAVTPARVVIRTGDGAILLDRAQIVDERDDDVRELRAPQIAARVGVARVARAEA
jgi:methionyl-tRNA formyltransferase